MRFSILIPVYNTEKYLRQCLDSIRIQSYKNFEVILINDGSTDMSSKICDEYAMKDERIKVIHKRNGGATSARKAGAEIAQGDYVVCLDSDDWYSELYLSEMSTLIDKYNPDIIAGGWILINDSIDKNIRCNLKGFGIGMYNKTESNSFQSKIKEEFGYYNRADIESKIFPHLIGFSNSIGGKVFKRELFLDVQLSVDNRIKMGEDACVVVPAVYKAKSMYITEACLYNYRYNPTSMTKSKSVYSLEEPKWIAEHLKKHIDINQNNFRQQIYCSTVHRLFNRCISQFYQDKPYKDICRDIEECLEDELYKEYIDKSQVLLTKSYKEWLAHNALKKRLYYLMKLYSKVR